MANIFDTQNYWIIAAIISGVCVLFLVLILVNYSIQSFIYKEYEQKVWENESALSMHKSFDKEHCKSTRLKYETSLNETKRECNILSFYFIISIIVLISWLYFFVGI